ncbi:MAG: C4-dicarboxylate ABC transporter [Acidobacteria bacterium]|nr:MAG: C4-dicarboxylate ABC transporter [Acidobacteriota bacterium]
MDLFSSVDPVAAISLGALLVAIVVSCTIRLHVGFLAISLAWVVGVYVAGMSAREVMSGFPTRLFLTLAGITLLFSQAQINGTLARVAYRAVKYARGNVGVMPMMFFLLAFGLASIGPGNIAATALVAPMAMAVSWQVGVPPFLMAIMVGMGANAGSLSPIAPTGVIVNAVMDQIGLGGFEIHTYLNNMMAHTLVVFVAYFALGGLPLLRRRHEGAVLVPTSGGDSEPGGDGAASMDFDRTHLTTLAMIAALILSVIFLGVDVGLGAFAGAVLLSLLKAGDEMEAVKVMPWRVIMMVCGVTVLISVLDATGGLALFTDILTRASAVAPTFIIAASTGFISIYSSTSGVVLPAFLPTVPGLAENLGVAPLALASAMNVGGHLVDVSPLSTLGALCMAAAHPSVDSRDLFNKLMIWGLSMTVVGGAVCYLLFTVLEIGLG